MSISLCARQPSEGRPGDRQWSRWPRQQCAESDQVVGGRSERDDPIDELAAAMAQFAQAADGFHAAEDLLDQRPLLLADRVRRATRGSVGCNSVSQLLSSST